MGGAEREPDGPVSQAAACDGNYYQILVEGDNTNPPPGVLPI